MYILNLIFNRLLETDFRITTDPAEFNSSSLPKLNYSSKPIADELFLKSHDMLFENETGNVSMACFDCADESLPKENRNVFFPSDSRSFFPFDLFAASFYLVTRYEEYTCPSFDKLGRFDESGSFSILHGFHKYPVVNIWTEALMKKINHRYPGLLNPLGKYRYLPTIDIDNAYAYLYKGLIRTSGAFLKSLLTVGFNDFIFRANVLINRKKDPYNTYEYLRFIHEKNNLTPLFFFLMGDYRRYDKNIPADHPQMQSLILHIARFADTGIHPSFHSNNDPSQLTREIERLAGILQKKITHSRQHYLKLSFPYTYNQLIKAGIKEDYSMGYVSHIGFRAGIASPFPFFDLSENREKDLLIYPFQIMDVTLQKYMKHSPDQAIQEVISVIQQIRKVRGLFISIWHNESLSGKENWKGWEKVYEKIIDKAV